MPELTDQLTRLRVSEDVYCVYVYIYANPSLFQERVKDATSEARGKSNPFERINKSIFINRAATKLAALDATFGLTSTQGNEVYT